MFYIVYATYKLRELLLSLPIVLLTLPTPVKLHFAWIPTPFPFPSKFSLVPPSPSWVFVVQFALIFRQKVIRTKHKNNMGFELICFVLVWIGFVIFNLGNYYWHYHKCYWHYPHGVRFTFCGNYPSHRNTISLHTCTT